MKFKTNVRLKDLSPQMVVALMAVDSAARDIVGRTYEATITSGNDGEHSEGSLHYVGNGLDVRIKDLPDFLPATVYASMIKTRLTVEYDVVVEPDHIHIEYDPKDA